MTRRSSEEKRAFWRMAVQRQEERGGGDGLSALVQEALQQDPPRGHLFLFRNRRRDRVRLLFWDGDGYAQFSKKRLARGTFEFPVPQEAQLILKFPSRDVSI